MKKCEQQFARNQNQAYHYQRINLRPVKIVNRDECVLNFFHWRKLINFDMSVSEFCLKRMHIGLFTSRNKAF